MSLSEEIKQAKKSLSNDEKIFESAFRIEVFLKKYYRVILGIIGIVLVYFIWTAVMKYQEEKRAERITQIFDQIQTDGLNEKLLNEIKKEGGEVSDFITLTWAIQENKPEELEGLKKSSNSFIAQYASYELGSMKQNFGEEKKYGEFANLILLQEGYRLMMDKKRQEALNKLNAIELTSPLKEWALRIGHYGIDF